VLAKPGVVRTIYDPTAGTGGMLSVAGEYLAEHNPQARLTMFGQELNDESYAICKADMLIKGQDVQNIIPGNTLSDDGHPHKVFDYMLSNPPFGVEWKKVEKAISRIFRNEDFGYRTITVERPLCGADGNIVLITKDKAKGDPQPDSNLRDTENVPLHEDVETYFKREVLPHAPDAWIDHDQTKVGYEIPFNRLFKPPRPLAEIDAELKGVTDRILTMIGALSA
jgi:hypothetical protein